MAKRGRDAVEPGTLYMIQELNKDGTPNGNFKIGTTVDAEKRLSDLQTGNPRTLTLKHQFKVKDRWGAEEETKADHQFGPYKSTLGGGTEWYVKPTAASWDDMKTMLYNIARRW